MHPLTLAAIASLSLLAGCATTDTAQARASCEAMEKDMGTGQVHDHGGMKGQGLNSMNIGHERCVALLAKPA